MFRKQSTQDQDDQFVHLASPDGIREASDESESSSDFVRSSVTSSHRSQLQIKPIQCLSASTSSFEEDVDLSKSHTESGFLYGSLFPKIQEQKPGVDYYGILTFNLLCLCVYLLIYYNDFSTSGLYQDKGIFQTEEITILFYLVVVLVAERYCARTENREIEELRQERHQRCSPAIRTSELFTFERTDSQQTSFESLVIKNLKF